MTSFLHRTALFGAIATMALTMPAFAKDFGEGLSSQDRYDQIKSMSDEEREAFFEERQKEWEGMSKDEKLAEIEKRRAERLQSMEQEWKQMNDDEKISYVEEKMQRMKEGKQHPEGKMPRDAKGGKPKRSKELPPEGDAGGVEPPVMRSE